MTLSLAISIKVDPSGLATGGAEAKRQLDAIGVGAKGAEQNLKEMEAAAVRASRAARDTARDTAEAMRSKLAAERAVGMQTFTPNRAADVAAYGAAMDALRAKHSPLFAAQRQYKSQLDEIRQAEKVGALTSIEAAAAIGRSKTSFASQVGAINASRAALAGHAAQSKLTSEQSKQLSYQLHDVVVSLASGMNPMIVALQQGSQITPLFGGIGGTMRALVGMINPVTASIAALVVTTAGGAAAWNSYLKSTLEVQTALTGLGRNSGATRRELEAIAQANAAGGGMTVSQARSIETQLLRTGKVGVESFGSVIRITRDFAATLGTDAEMAPAWPSV